MPDLSPLLTGSLIYHLSVKDGLSFNHGLASSQMPAGAMVSCKRELECALSECLLAVREVLTTKTALLIIVVNKFPPRL